MKRDMELIRHILFFVEENQKDKPLLKIEIENYDITTINYHIQLMIEANLLEGGYDGSGRDIQYHRYHVRMTWQGHDFLDACRDSGRWKQAKDVFAKVGGVTFDVAVKTLATIAMDQVKHQLGLQ
ncbi:DUF2513 domain-containing protein [Oceanidesulfovibrio marinus]|uniref:DUF2513 domain-containing protein n=1 Tax=Oceanidesulfovibrio marinus TaxID=370038 RepID=A0A6P1ZAZ4_9BACT|nr:DUF2513 domain-containing protein [Oceanidesulfovibrio marinus]TVM30459.1 hypothetical protein DQK91_20965 [Oceanidesulfovibrio marinus]